MIHSMTGFGRGEAAREQFKFVVEIKTVNHRYLDILIRMPKKLNQFEDRLKAIIKSKISRGRVEIYITSEESVADDFVITPNFTVLDQYQSALQAINARYGISDPITLSMLSRYPDALKTESKESDEETIWAALSEAAESALEALMDMRRREGATLRTDIMDRVNVVRATALEIDRFSPQILAAYRQKMTDRIREILADTVELDEGRILHEVAVYADKSNVAEEIVRLNCHLDQVDRILDDPAPAGRKLDFLVQEMNREINTIGSKSPDLTIANHVIEAKSEIEKIREQIQNIE